jgi:signal transduction histidine kinase
MLDNAIDAVAEGGHIRVRTWEEETRRPPPRRPAPSRATPSASAIADDGAGIPLESQARTSSTPSTPPRPSAWAPASAWASCSASSEQYGGSVTFASEPGNTEFRVRLPRDRD